MLYNIQYTIYNIQYTIYNIQTLVIGKKLKKQLIGMPICQKVSIEKIII